ncbi:MULTISPECIES: hypothetical protein [Limnospira]|uniref:Uncharacterized protein n=1 Tax=Limnospira platensis NIES-46 TaxID=1236695 RepID=A0A5M3T6E1_LIMPL|nr:hypothetical protein [Arthrospira platensis]MDF2207959.1 hypothetical protein [Arthrospira platensis NCB002]MDT9184349.1 hypothetical protein [Limnospira sp. PMC 289.06]MDT9296531.1 hypothetical protein [Arthrospira platensis PCC 7345]WAK73868.1 hypothetical protein AP9108_35780 [Arthrospira sp. PCC 9108]BDT15025.1 hypothetical protein N39L_47480 [Arthrospira platensis NIES-39]
MEIPGSSSFITTHQESDSSKEDPDPSPRCGWQLIGLMNLPRSLY